MFRAFSRPDPARLRPIVHKRRRAEVLSAALAGLLAVLLVPQAAVGSSQLGKYLYVVGANSSVEQRMVRLGTVSGDKVSILSGVAAGDQVITGNLQKIGPGMPVQAIPEKPGSAS